MRPVFENRAGAVHVDPLKIENWPCRSVRTHAVADGHETAFGLPTVSTGTGALHVDPLNVKALCPWSIATQNVALAQPTTTNVVLLVPTTVGADHFPRAAFAGAVVALAAEVAVDKVVALARDVVTPAVGDVAVPVPDEPHPTRSKHNASDTAHRRPAIATPPRTRTTANQATPQWRRQTTSGAVCVAGAIRCWSRRRAAVVTLANRPARRARARRTPACS